MGAPPNVTQLSAVRHADSTEFKVFESVEEAVREEIKLLPLAASRPSEVSAALRLAQILDDPAAANRVAAAEKLRVTMDGLRREVAGERSKLATLRALREAR